MRYLIIILIMVTGCNLGPFRKDNKKKKSETSRQLDKISAAMITTYCPLAKENYIKKGGRISKCDSALFGGLLGTACSGIDITPFEKEDEPGKMCRTWECDCYLPETETDNGSDSQYSKDMNTGIQLNLAVNRDQPELVDRIVSYLQTNVLVMCEAIDLVTKASKCILPVDSMGEWLDMQEQELRNPPFRPHPWLVQPQLEFLDFTDHLQILGAIKQGEIYGAVSDISLGQLKRNAESEPNNVLFVAANALYTDGDMTEAATKWLEQCPIDRLPNNHDDWCTPYKWQRGEASTYSNGKRNWDTCPDEELVEHPGVDCAFAGWLILHHWRI